MTPQNPWLAIPLADYESHMALPEIGQAQLLREQLLAAAQGGCARSVAIAGCAGGNGLAELGRLVPRIVAVDLNPHYIEAVRRRFAGRITGLETYVTDLEQGAPACAPVDLVYAGLLFEYVNVCRAMASLRQLCRDGGELVAVIQLAAGTPGFVSPSPYGSLRPLEAFARLHSSSALDEHASRAGFSTARWRSIRSAGGKGFEVGTFKARCGP
ncbi:MAG TPA: class I SAM-dependent methyltransferase [Steroidobacteraceae bacterium]|nr:class I SAM-dependent methyltransferase [Steroidobacteraceae bacterium]